MANPLNMIEPIMNINTSIFYLIVMIFAYIQGTI